MDIEKIMNHYYIKVLFSLMNIPNFNCKIQKLFEKIGELVVCKFDRNDFGVFLGSATVQYKRPEHAKQAIEEYHEGLLDEKVLVVEYDIERVELNPETEGNQKILYLNN